MCSYALRPPSCPDHDHPLSDPTGAGSDRYHHDHDRALSDPGRHHLQQLGGLVDQLGLLLQLRHPDHHRLRRHGARKQVRLTLQVRSGQVRSGQVRSGQVRDRSAGQVRSGKVSRSETGQARCWPGQVRSDQVRSGALQVRSGQVRDRSAGQVRGAGGEVSRSGQVRSGQVRHRSETGQARCWPGQVRSDQVRSGALQVRSSQQVRDRSDTLQLTGCCHLCTGADSTYLL